MLAQQTDRIDWTALDITCSVCPFARHIEGDRYECTATCGIGAPVAKGHHKATTDCYSELDAYFQPDLIDPRVGETELLTDESVYDTGAGYRYCVQLVSRELDFEGVPMDAKIVDVLVTAPDPDLVRSAIAGAGWLSGWMITDAWQPKLEIAPF